MAYATTDPKYKLRITIDCEDEAGYQWRRTDTSQPRRVDEEPLVAGSLPNRSVSAAREN
jgi:hypothetical protein